MRLAAVLLLLALAAPADAAGQRASRAPRRAPAPPAGPTARFRCWSERPEDCAAAADRLLKAGGLRRAARTPDSGWSQDLTIVFRRASTIPAAARVLGQFVDELRPHRFGFHASLQGGRQEWMYATDQATPAAAATPAPAAPIVARPAQGTLRRVKERPRAGDLELALTGEGGKVLLGTEHEVDGVLRNLGTRPITLELAHDCDLDVAVTPRGSDRLAALSPCANAPATLRIAPADSFAFRGADVPSDATGSFTAYATLVGTLDGAPVQLRTRPLRVDFRKAAKAEVADWATPRAGCTPAPLPRPARGEVAGSFMVSLLPGVDADALARYLAKERKLSVAVSTPRYLSLRGSDADAAAVACLGGVERVVRDVEGKRD